MIRLIFAVILLLLSLLTVFRAPTNFLWLTAVAVTNYCYVFFIVALAVLIASFFAEHYKVLTIIVSIGALVLYSMPVIMSYQRGSHLSAEISTVFPYENNEHLLKAPFSFLKMFSGIEVKSVKPQTFVYKRLPEKDLVIDYYAESGGKTAPCIIVIHGGSWQSGDSKQLPQLNSYLAAQGYNVAAITYRMAPKYQCPAPVEDVQEAMNYLDAHAAELKIDTNRYVLIGRSAGAQIALLAAYTANDPNIKGVVDIYGPADMVWGATAPSNKWVLDTDKVLGDFVGGSYKQVPDKYMACSPLEFVKPSSTPTLIIHGKPDAMVAYEHSVHLQDKLTKNHVPFYFLNLPCATHGCDYNINGPDGQVTTYAIERFIASVTR
jgi:acetyl esterase/lipase